MPGEHWDAVVPKDVLAQLRRQHPNLLLIGPTGFVNGALKTVEPLLLQPIVSWSPYDQRDIPDGSYATLVVHRIDTADGEQQRHLCEWFESRSRPVQVISTALAPLYPFVTAGTFIETLYYRLNHVCLISGTLGCG